MTCPPWAVISRSAAWSDLQAPSEVVARSTNLVYALAFSPRMSFLAFAGGNRNDAAEADRQDVKLIDLRPQAPQNPPRLVLDVAGSKTGGSSVWRGRFRGQHGGRLLQRPAQPCRRRTHGRLRGLRPPRPLAHDLCRERGQPRVDHLCHVDGPAANLEPAHGAQQRRPGLHHQSDRRGWPPGSPTASSRRDRVTRSQRWPSPASRVS